MIPTTTADASMERETYEIRSLYDAGWSDWSPCSKAVYEAVLPLKGQTGQEVRVVPAAISETNASTAERCKQEFVEWQASFCSKAPDYADSFLEALGSCWAAAWQAAQAAPKEAAEPTREDAIRMTDEFASMVVTLAEVIEYTRPNTEEALLAKGVREMLQEVIDPASTEVEPTLEGSTDEPIGTTYDEERICRSGGPYETVTSVSWRDGIGPDAGTDIFLHATPRTEAVAHISIDELRAIVSQHDRVHGKAEAAAVAPDANSEVKQYAQRYAQLRVLGCAPSNSPALERGEVHRFTVLDDFIDTDMATHGTRGAAPIAHPAAPSNVREQALEEGFRKGTKEAAKILHSLADRAPPTARDIARSLYRDAARDIEALKLATPDVGKGGATNPNDEEACAQREREMAEPESLERARHFVVRALDVVPMDSHEALIAIEHALNAIDSEPKS